ncbi:replication factor C large subunit [Nanoarchaeota archaeon]
MQLWTEKYKPKKEEEIIGQQEPLEKIKRFITNYKKSKKNAILITGPNGSGKSIIPNIVISKLNWELVEVNSSDFRDKEKINTKLKSALYQQSLFSQGKLIFVDDVDATSAKDRGFLQALQKLIEDSTYPFILTATDISDFKFNSIKKVSNIIELNPLSTDIISDRLEHICKEEGVNCKKDLLKRIARRSGNDLRGSINDLQSLFIKGKEITLDDIETLSEREHSETIINALTKIFKTTDLDVAIKSFDYVSGDIKQYMLWIDENLPKEYDSQPDISNAYNNISKADIFNRRIMNRQYWRFLVYINAYLSAGIALSKQNKYKKMTMFSPPGRLLKIFWANQRSFKKKSIGQKIFLHDSLKDFIKNDFPYINEACKNDKNLAKAIAEQYELDKDELNYLLK